MEQRRRACAAVIRDGAILMLLVDHGNHSHWSLPGGGIDSAETPAEAAIRELWEEAGLHGTDPVLLYQRSTRSLDETCFLLSVSVDQEPVLGTDPERGDGDPRLTAVGWRHLTDLCADVQGTLVLDALRRLHTDA